MPLSYAAMFGMTRMWSYELHDRAVYDLWVNQREYKWIRRVNDRKFSSIVRNPTVGCLVELTTLQHPGSIPIDSDKAKKMIKRVCYF